MYIFAVELITCREDTDECGTGDEFKDELRFAAQCGEDAANPAQEEGQ